ncbi:hypothetical protein F5Y16DRAFT_421597 [Xylariaceae sp. FL0255]|nr:hypothetical protein F5Y16DRAFT_421597 [Xylariaceae sp. FL0255]
MNLLKILALAATAAAGNISLPGYPLAEKTPYLSAWLGFNSSTDVPKAMPFFWMGQNLTWQVLARIDDDAYCLFGCPDASVNFAKQVDISFTSTRTLITLEAGSATFLLDFFSPISLTDYTRQSIPYSYLSVQVSQVRAGSTVDVLTAIDDSWTAQAPNTQVEFTETDSRSSIFALSGTNSYTWAENTQMAAWGQVVLAANPGAGGHVTFQAGGDIISQLSSSGTLTKATSGYESGDLVAMAYHFTADGTSTTVTFTIGVEQENAFNYLGEPQTGYYQASLSDTSAVVDYLFSDFSAAATEGTNLDTKIQSIGHSISSNYSDVLEASMRQIFAAMQILIPLDSKDTSLAAAWMKEISTDGNVQTLADLLPKAFPAFYVLAPDYMRLLLEPVMKYALIWPAEFGFHDMGKHYPNATGETVADQEALIVDQTSVILWMAYAYQKASGDTEWVKPYVSVLQGFADYLVDNGLYTASQQSSVDSIGPTANQTILAMYSAIGLNAFGAMTGQANYTKVGKQFADVILEKGTDSEHTHITAHFGDPDDVWISTYPLAFDTMLDLGTFNSSTSEMQSTFYESKLSTYGMVFFSGVEYAVGSFMLWCAATSSDTVRNSLINGVHAFFEDGLNSQAMPTRWYVTGDLIGEWVLSVDKPTAGSYFMPVAINMYK